MILSIMRLIQETSTKLTMELTARSCDAVKNFLLIVF